MNPATRRACAERARREAQLEAQLEARAEYLLALGGLASLEARAEYLLALRHKLSREQP